MQQSLYINKLRHRRQRIPKRAAGRHIDMSYNKFKLNSSVMEGGDRARIASTKPNKVDQLERKLQMAQQYIELLENQALNYRVYVKNLELTEEQYVKTNRIANQIRENERNIKMLAQQYRLNMDSSKAFSEKSPGKQNISEVGTICCNRHKNW